LTGHLRVFGRDRRTAPQAVRHATELLARDWARRPRREARAA